VGTVPDHLVARLEARCRELAGEPPSADRVERVVRAAIRAHEEQLYARIRDRLTPETRAHLEALLQPESDAGSGLDGDGQPGAAPALLLRLRCDPGRPSLAGVQAELARLELVRRVGLPADLLDHVLHRELERYRRRIPVDEGVPIDGVARGLLHLLQNCMIYVNTLMLQQVLAQPHWRQKLERRDLSALTPLIWEHVNP
jgi:hypothetical protein